MKLTLDGRRLNEHEARELLALAGEIVMAATMAAAGFRMKPVRAPKGLHNGNLVMRFAWEKRDGNLKAVIRSTIILEGAGLA
jgi:hypothetical protein